MKTLAPPPPQRRANRLQQLTKTLLPGISAALLVTTISTAQPAPPNGPPANPPRFFALTQARVFVNPDQLINNATIVIRDGIIESVAADTPPPAGARIFDLTGKTVHAGFIDLSVSVNIPANALPAAPGRHWNSKVHPELNAASLPGLTKADRAELRAIGFTAALIAPATGIFRGSSAFINLAEPADHPRTYLTSGPQVIEFETGGWGSEEYPGSLIGALALIRQTFHDAEWYRQATQLYQNHPAGIRAPAPALALHALFTSLPPADLQEQATVIIRSRDELDFLRAAGLAEEFNLKAIIKGSGHEFRRLRNVVATQLPIILPLNLPDPPHVSSLEDAETVTLRALQQWEQQPTNPRRLLEAGVAIAFTTESAKSKNAFLEYLQRTIKEGLTETQALAALTTTPARLIGLDNILGTVEPGKTANLVVLEGTDELFSDTREVSAIWVDGTRYEIKTDPRTDPRGTYQLTANPGQSDALTTLIPINELTFKITGKTAAEPTLTILLQTPPDAAPDPDPNDHPKEKSPREIKTQSLSIRANRLTAVVAAADLNHQRTGWDRLAFIIDGKNILGTFVTADNQTIHYRAQRYLETRNENERNETAIEKNAAGADEYQPAPDQFPTPLGAYGRLEPPTTPETIFIKNATLWTGGTRGIIQNCDLIIQSGKITRIDPDLTPPKNAYLIEATGKHVTAGIIDAHSHTGISRGAINESTQAITAEVRINDVINPDDISWYRQLAGGVTTVNQLHGSANPIGGQNSVVKIKWGDGPEDFKFNAAIPGIKFALGENVKQANWGEKYTTRYPQSRLGVEAIIRAAFAAALDYEKEHQHYQALAAKEKLSAIPPRKDLELEALLEIIHGKRLIHCHSYRQDEILMLIRLAEDFGFTIGTFQHVLEGYKVAREIAEHGAGASCFSDWWAYKFEVYDAIPYAGAIMHDNGILTSFNSDSNELARRLNLEAAKAVKYGNLDPLDALNFVTLNPAKQLRIDQTVGSLEIGKTADFVVWSGNPLSTLTKCEQTWIEGKLLFSLQADARLRTYAESESNRIIQKILALNLSRDEIPSTATDENETTDPNLTERHWFQNQTGLDDNYETIIESMPRGTCGVGLQNQAHTAH